MKSEGKAKIVTGSSHGDIVESYVVILIFPTDLVLDNVPFDLKDLDKGSQIILRPQTIVKKIVWVSGNNFIFAQGIGAIVGMDILSSAHITMNDSQLIVSF